MRIIRFIVVAVGVAIATTHIYGADTFVIDSKKSKISFSIKNKPPNAAEFQDVAGSFSDFSGEVVFDEADPSKSKVTIEVMTDSVDTENKKRDEHLKNQDFFKVKEFPKMTFKSTKVVKNDEGKYEIEGDFTLLDKTKIVKVIFEPTSENGGKSSFQIKRSDYGMTYRVPDTADEVDITLMIVGTKK
ncbi:MAG: YceI family protein [Verrucomicrobiales bacterium]